MLRLDAIHLESRTTRDQSTLNHFLCLLIFAIFATQSPFYLSFTFDSYFAQKFSFILMLANSTLNPLLYSYRMKRVKTSLISLFRKSSSDFVPPV